MAGKRMINQKRSPTRRAGRFFYRTVVTLSAVVVVLFCAYKVVARPPEQAPPTIATPPQAQPTDDPNTEEREDLAEPVVLSLERKPGCWTFLLAASDQVSSNADTVMVAMYDTVAQQVGLVSIPRDTLVSREYHKINSAYQKGPENLQSVVSSVLGIPIDHYITIDIRGFIKLVDAVGGIDFNVPIHMGYDDPTQDLHIHFEPGMQHLNGTDAMKVARLRKNNDGTMAYADSDISRTRTQQQIMTAIAKRVLANPQKLGEYIKIFSDYIKTDLTLPEMLYFVQPAMGFDLSAGLQTATLPGDGDVTYRGTQWCYQLYPEETLEIINQMINPYTTEVTREMTNILQVR